LICITVALRSLYATAAYLTLMVLGNGGATVTQPKRNTLMHLFLISLEYVLLTINGNSEVLILDTSLHFGKQSIDIFLLIKNFLNDL
jgi:hypothetical protein